ncbi:MAG: hypothetical protein QXE01_10465 [Sulfolobales archaeon]
MLGNQPPDDYRWGLTAIAPSPREGIGVMAGDPPRAKPCERLVIYYRIERGGGQFGEGIISHFYSVQWAEQG